MKKIIAVVGSPKLPEQSTTFKLINEFFEMLRERNNEIETEVIPLVQRDILACKGCMSCTKTGKCVINDDLASIKEKMQGADLLIFGSPVHFNHVSSVFHKFIERLLVDLHTFEFIGKPFINFVTTNGSGEEEAEKYLTKIGLLMGAIKLGSILKIDNDKFDENKISNLAKLTASILAGEKKLKPKIMNSLYFNSMKNIIQSNSKYFTYENTVWNERDWFNKSYKQIVNGR